MNYVFSPNSLNYIICNRCFYLEQKYAINFSGGFPQVFSDLDIAQKNYFIDKSTSFLSSATTTIAADCWATIFSLNRAAPPPFIN